MSITRAIHVLDHLLLGVADLDEGTTFVERLTGVSAVIGGSHPGRGTRNALMALSGRQYLEIIAPDPDQDVETPLADLGSPALVQWAALTNDIESLDAELRAAGLETSGPRPGARARPDGRMLSWKTLGLPRTFAQGAVDLMPFFIQWDAATVHPSQDSPRGGELVALEFHHPEPEALRKVFAKVGIEANVCEGVTPRIVAAIRTASGIVTL